MSDYENRNRNNGGGGLLVGLVGLAIAGAATAYKAYKDGSKQSDEMEKIRREQADQQEMKRHNAIASTDFIQNLEDQTYAHLILLCETAICNIVYQEDEYKMKYLSEQIDTEELEQLKQYASNGDIISGFYSFLLADQESIDEDEYLKLELLAKEAYNQNYPYAIIITSISDKNKTVVNETLQSDLSTAFIELKKSYTTAELQGSAKPQDLFMFGMLCYLGLGCEKDLELAESAFRLAAKQNFSLSIDALHQYMNIDPTSLFDESHPNDSIDEEDTNDDWDDVFEELDETTESDNLINSKIINEENNNLDAANNTNEDIVSQSQVDNEISQNISRSIDFAPVQSVYVPCHTLQELVMYMRKYDFCNLSCDNLLFPGDMKFEKKLKNAKRSYANISTNETILCLCDTTLLGSAKEGFVLTNQALYSKPMLESAITIPISKIIGVKAKEKKLIVLYDAVDNTQEIQLDTLMAIEKATKGAEHLAMLISIARSI